MWWKVILIVLGVAFLLGMFWSREHLDEANKNGKYKP
jgi:hypothetical protein